MKSKLVMASEQASESFKRYEEVYGGSQKALLSVISVLDRSKESSKKRLITL